MKSEEFIKQQISAGYSIHSHDNVWWQKIAPFFYKPVLPLQEIVPGVAKPKNSNLLLGYSHIISQEQSASKYWCIMLLDNEKLRNFSLTSLSSAKRARVRKGLKQNEIKRIECIDAVIGDIKTICISQAVRTGHGKSPDYYNKHYTKWRAFMTREFSLPGREWWGAFNHGVLGAYYYAYQIEDTMFISAAKSHSNYLTYCPNDALLFTFIDYCRDRTDCKGVIFGDWSEAVSSLNDFKKKYGFEKTELPVYVRYNPAVRLLKRFIAR
ncbi:MAG: hypothetical protein ACE144_10125 [Thermodesulfobacteriota bacterium]